MEDCRGVRLEAVRCDQDQARDQVHARCNVCAVARGGDLVTKKQIETSIQQILNIEKNLIMLMNRMTELELLISKAINNLQDRMVSIEKLNSISTN